MTGWALYPLSAHILCSCEQWCTHCARYKGMQPQTPMLGRGDVTTSQLEERQPMRAGQLPGSCQQPWKVRAEGELGTTSDQRVQAFHNLLEHSPHHWWRAFSLQALVLGAGRGLLLHRGRCSLACCRVHCSNAWAQAASRLLQPFLQQSFWGQAWPMPM